ncbi:hypothetical protein K431DRAFT_129166 [Polychaeton citri CBS 116435]|uniref:Uncharacterized protein n=1 Tax=Polychaeton citri CBS 116435 TaxID=1314669 RepID=A0A9P4Q129_9PEZI|nr:hypothetical protein K431DRAFT_129166 [Polychaeton citri CBS 116435]
MSDASRIMRIAFMSGITVKNHVSGLPRIQEVFDDRVEAWIGYPLARNVVFYRPTLYLRERCRFAGLLHEMYDLVSVNNQQHNGAIRAFTGEVDRLSARMERWYQYLPFELQYGWPMSVAVWELHASYLAALMALWVAARTQLQQKQNLPEDELPPAESDDENISFKSRTARDMLSKALPLAYRATQILHDFRKRYGLKITPAWLLQLQAVAAGVLLQDPELADATTIASSGDGESGGTINDSRTAFDEVFRCLLGTGVQVMVARGIARMMYHTSLQKNIKMSQSMRSVLQIMSDTAWRPSDLSLVSSTFPNYATTKGYLDSERMTELLMKWEALET